MTWIFRTDYRKINWVWTMCTNDQQLRLRDCKQQVLVYSCEFRSTWFKYQQTVSEY